MSADGRTDELKMPSDPILDLEWSRDGWQALSNRLGDQEGDPSPDPPPGETGSVSPDVNSPLPPSGKTFAEIISSAQKALDTATHRIERAESQIDRASQLLEMLQLLEGERP